MNRLVLPLPPSLNHSHINVKRGNRLMRIRSDATKAFYTEAGWLAKQWVMKSKWTQPEPNTKLITRIWIFWPDNRKRDSDNALKLTLDSLKGIVFEDDRQVLPRVIDYTVDKQNPRVELEFEEAV